MTKKLKTLIILLGLAMTATALQAGTTIVVPMGLTPVDSGNNLTFALAIAAGGPAPVLIKLSPGVYDLNGMGIVVPNGVDIEGSGRNITTILSNIPGVDAPGGTVVVPANTSTELRDLTVRNESPTHGFALRNESHDLRVTRCDFEADTSILAMGIRNVDAAPSLSDIRIKVHSEGTALGILVFGGDPTIVDTLVIASGGEAVGVRVHNGAAPFIDQLAVLGLGENNIGFESIQSSPRLFRSRFTVIGTAATGVSLIRSAAELKDSVADAIGSTGATTGLAVTSDSPRIEESSFRASGNLADSVGVRIFGVASPEFDRCTAQGASNSVLMDVPGSRARFGASKLVGPTAGPNLTQLTCISSYNGSYVGVDANCQ